jgi:hypothetical protein
MMVEWAANRLAEMDRVASKLLEWTGTYEAVNAAEPAVVIAIRDGASDIEFETLAWTSNDFAAEARLRSKSWASGSQHLDSPARAGIDSGVWQIDSVFTAQDFGHFLQTLVLVRSRDYQCRTAAPSTLSANSQLRWFCPSSRSESCSA